MPLQVRKPLSSLRSGRGNRGGLRLALSAGCGSGAASGAGCSTSGGRAVLSSSN